MPPKLSGSILVVEDNPDVQRLFTLQVTRLGPSVDIANHGLEAIEAITKKHYDLVFMDMQMPVMDGITAIKQIRLLGYKTPIIVLTANALTEFRQACLDTGCDDYLTKPVDWNSFSRLITKYIPYKQTPGPVTPLHSLLVKQDPDFEEIVNHFLHKLPATRQILREHFTCKDWDACKNRIHELKGLGGAMGYPDLTQVAIQVEDCLKMEEYDHLDELLALLYKTIDRMLA